MSKKWILLTSLIVSLGSAGALHAGPLDSPEIVYIDGQPCNLACQSYMTWSARARSARYRGHYEARVVVPEVERPMAVKPSRMVRKPVPASHTMSRAAMAMPKARAAMPKNDVASRAAPAPRTAPSAATDAQPTITVASIRAAMASAPATNQDNLVALVLVPQDINALSDLNNKRIAIAEKQSALSGRVSAALMAAGAAEVQFSESKESAIDRLTNGEVPAAVVLAPREIAALFPEMAGYRTFRLPLTAPM